MRRTDLDLPDDYAEIAGALAAAGRVDEAIDWARRGLDASASRHWQAGPLRDLLADLLRRIGDEAGGVELYWTALVDHPSAEAYRAYVNADPGDGASQRAIEHLRAAAAASPDRPSDDGMAIGRPGGPVPTLIDVLLHEGRVDEAWQVAVERGCDQRRWLVLAQAREADHPLDAIPIYRRAALAAIDTVKRGGYEQAVRLLTRIERAAAAAGSPEVFDELVDGIVADHKRKTSLMAMLDQKGWRQRAVAAASAPSG